MYGVDITHYDHYCAQCKKKFKHGDKIISAGKGMVHIECEYKYESKPHKRK